MIIALGYRNNFSKATQFRIAATKVLKEFLTKGEVKKPLSRKEMALMVIQAEEALEKLALEDKEHKCTTLA